MTAHWRYSLKILAIDIETAPNTAYVWGLFKQNIGINQLVETGRVMCFSAKWLDSGETVFKSEHSHGHKRTITAAHKLLSQADAILTFNGENFDLPILNKEFIKYGILPPAPYASIDLLRVAKKRFKFTSNRMKHLAEELGIEQNKIDTTFELWVDCMNGDDDAWELMEAYNTRDVEVLEQLYHKMLPWIDNHPNMALYTEVDEPTCTNCGSDDLHRHGLQHNKTHSYWRYQCQDCGTWVRARFSETKKNPNILVQVKGS